MRVERELRRFVSGLELFFVAFGGLQGGTLAFLRLKRGLNKRFQRCFRDFLRVFKPFGVGGLEIGALREV
jgi:hypothetical protein